VSHLTAHDRPVRTGLPVVARWWVLAVTIYLGLGIAVMANAWSAGFTDHTVTPSGDPALLIWSLSYAAKGVASLNLPLTTPLLFHPTGFNLLANTTSLGLGVPLTPLTWIIGPVGTMNVILTVAPCASGAALIAALRRHGTWWPAAIAAGGLWGFSPFVLYGIDLGWLMTIVAVGPPLLWLTMHELLVARRWRPSLTGAVISLVLVWQFWIGSEVLAITCTVGAFVALAVLIAQLISADDRRQVGRHVGVGLAVGALLMTVLLAYPVAWALAGDAHLDAWVWPALFFAFNTVHLSDYLGPLTTARDFVINLAAREPNVSFLGWGLMATITAVMIAAWKDLRLWLLVGLGLLGGLTAAGSSLSWSPWEAAYRLPILHNVMAQRWVIVVIFAAAMALGIGVTDVTTSIRRRSVPSWLPGAIGSSLLLVALAPVMWADAASAPVPVGPTTAPSFFISHPQGGVTMMTPFPNANASGLTWEAVGGIPTALVGGWGPQVLDAPGTSGTRAQEILSNMTWLPPSRQGSNPADVRVIRSIIAQWGVTEVLAASPRGTPATVWGHPATGAVGLFTEAFGPPTAQGPGWWSWSRPGSTRGTIVPLEVSQQCINAARGHPGAVSGCLATRGSLGG